MYKQARGMQKALTGATTQRRLLVGVALLDLLSTGTTLAQMTFLSRIVAGVIFAQQHLAQVLPQAFLLLGTICVHAGLVWVREIVARYGAIRAKIALRRRVFAHLLKLGPAYSKGESTGELVTVLYEGLERLDTYVSRYLPQVSASVLVPLLIVVFLFPLDWISGLLLLVTGPLIPVLMIAVGGFAQKHIDRQWQTLARLGATLLDAIQGLTTLKLFDQSKQAGRRIEQVSESFRVRTLKMLRAAFLSGAVLEFLVAGAIGLVAVTLGVRLINKEIDFGTAFLILLLAPEFYRPLRELGVQYHAGMEGRAAARRVDEILATPIPVSSASTHSPRPAGPLTITISHLTYMYPGSAQPALEDINLTLPAGTCTALIGRSGAGKSTLVNLLLRFLDPRQGAIHVNGIALTDLPVETWRECIALVPQRPTLFSGSVLDNLRLARPDASDEEIAQAAELAGATEFIAQLPRGYATLLGERGARLSAGQAQRLAIARAFLKDAPLLILDEPTSSLDPVSETLIRQALARLVRQRTVLVIAHRANTLAGARQVALLDTGRLSESGPPSTFLQRDEWRSDPAACSGQLEVTR